MRKLRIYPDPVLRKKAKPVKQVNQETLELLDEMVQIMRASNGIGLAAPQVGESKQLIVIEIGKELLKLINPKIISKKGKASITEGCLSFPELGVKVCRAQKIRVKALNEKKKEVLIDADDLLAICLQHEIDHLYGKTIIDYISWPKRWLVHKKFKQNKEVL